MAVVTIYRLAEQAFALIEGGNPAIASSLSLNTLKIACGQVINSLLKVEQFSINEKMGESIPNGSVLATYEDIVPYAWVTGKSKALLPIKPIKLKRNMGVFSVYFTDDPDNPFIPMQMGELALIQSQSQINELLGQIGYENKSLELRFNKDLPSLFPNKTITVELVVMDISQYGDWDALPVLPEQEWDIITAVYKMYSTQPIPDKVVDSTVKENKNVPLTQQKQSP